MAFGWDLGEQAKAMGLLIFLLFSVLSNAIESNFPQGTMPPCSHKTLGKRWKSSHFNHVFILVIVVCLSSPFPTHPSHSKPNTLSFCTKDKVLM